MRKPRTVEELAARLVEYMAGWMLDPDDPGLYPEMERALRAAGITARHLVDPQGLELERWRAYDEDGDQPYVDDFETGVAGRAALEDDYGS